MQSAFKHDEIYDKSIKGRGRRDAIDLPEVEAFIGK